MNTKSLIALLAAAGMMAADLPVKRVVLYKHGVGLFERSAELSAGQSARLDFKNTEMNDVLKSLTVTESGGAKVTGVRYDSNPPLAKRLEDFPFGIGEHTPLALFLDQLRGSKVEMQSGGTKIAGAIVSGRVAAAEEKQPARELVVLFTDSGELRTVDLASTTSIKFTDPALELQLKEFLQTVNQSKSDDRRTVYIDSTDAKSRTVTASYLVPTAVWKSSYRLILKASGQPVLEGWAIVDNTTGEDWVNVRMSLVAGKPVSFQSRLYEPRFIERPFADLPEDRAVAPVLYGRAVPATAPAAAAGMIGGAMDMASRKAGPRESLNVVAQRMELESSANVLNATRDMGELFSYDFEQPVSVKKNGSAMLPFLQQPVDAKKLLIYSNLGESHPRTAAELINQTGKTLDGGPITVFDSSAYAGEALVETVKAGEKRLISYGVDLGTSISSNVGAGSTNVQEYRLNRGVLTIKTGYETTRTYSINNVDSREKTLIIEHPLVPGHKILGQTPFETTASAYRFKLTLKPSASTTFPVKEEYSLSNQLMISSLSPDQLLVYSRNNALSTAGRKAIDAILAKKRDVAANSRALQQTSAEMALLEQDQQRIRQNIGSLNSVSGQQQQVQKYAQDLAAKELQLSTLRDRANEQRRRKDTLESELNSLIEQLEF